jgi:hypothetical protein
MMSGKLPANSFICNIDTAQMSGFREIAVPGQPPSHAEGLRGPFEAAVPAFRQMPARKAVMAGKGHG